MRWFGGVPANFGPDPAHEAVLREVVLRRCYRKAGFGFDVEAGEHWLDLGAHLGSFAVYCRVRGATADCFEPREDLFRILRLNTKAPGFHAVNAAVTADHAVEVRLWWPKSGDDRRSSVVKSGGAKLCPPSPNVFVGSLAGPYDGVKMDIEGAEFEIIDKGLIPPCRKLVLEYHTSRDGSIKNLAGRLEKLGRHFQKMKVPPEYLRKIAEGEGAKTYFDRLVFCKDPR